MTGCPVRVRPLDRHWLSDAYSRFPRGRRAGASTPRRSLPEPAMPDETVISDLVARAEALRDGGTEPDLGALCAPPRTCSRKSATGSPSSPPSTPSSPRRPAGPGHPRPGRPARVPHRPRGGRREHGRGLRGPRPARPDRRAEDPQPPRPDPAGLPEARVRRPGRRPPREPGRHLRAGVGRRLVVLRDGVRPRPALPRPRPPTGGTPPGARPTGPRDPRPAPGEPAAPGHQVEQRAGHAPTAG